MISHCTEATRILGERTNMARRLRLKKLNNWTVQGPIVVRLVTHFGAYNAASLFLMMTVWGIRSALASIADQPTSLPALTFWQQAAPVLICMLVMTPFMVWDLMRLTNRIAGPLFRFECLMKEFVKSGTLQHAKLRDGDLLIDFQQQFNEFAEALHALYPETMPVPVPSIATEDSTKPVSETVAENESTGKNSVAIPLRRSV